MSKPYCWLMISLSLVACGDGEGAKPADPPARVDSAVPDAADSAVLDTTIAADAGNEDVPTNGAALLPWLQARSYASFPKESKVHASSGPHGASVRTYITRSLDASLSAKAAEHPAGAAMIKEFYSGSDVSGWAVAVKTAPTSAGGDNWYWYEIFGTTSATKPVADGKGLPGCKGCHSGGKDFFLSPYPLQ